MTTCVTCGGVDTSGRGECLCGREIRREQRRQANLEQNLRVALVCSPVFLVGGFLIYYLGSQ